MNCARFDAADVHARLGPSGWTETLRQLGVGDEFLRGRGKPGPCPTCGGTDRYVYDNRKGRGDWYCRQCDKAGDGFELLRRLFGWDFPTTIARVAAVAGMSADTTTSSPAPIRAPAQTATPEVRAIPTARVRDLLRNSCEPSQVPCVVAYLNTRGVWPLPNDCTLRAHAGAEYWDAKQRVGRYSALVAPVVDIAGELVTVHVTYLDAGRKLATHEPRKILSGMTGRTGCAVRLVPVTGDTLGIAEGIETALSAMRLHELPVWAALNTALLSKFEPPKSVRKLIVFADADQPGVVAAARLMERLQGRVTVELRVPAPPHKDWNDALLGRTPC
jgi:putative DNA primase/helicase